MPAAPIRSIVFDIGWVFVRLNYAPFLEFLSARGAHAPDMEAVISRIALEEHESGRLHGDELLERLAGLAVEPVPLHEVRAHWTGMFELDAAMVDLAHRLAAHYRVHLLSNIGDLHWAHLSREFRLHAHRPWRAALLPRRRHEAAPRDLRRGREALCTDAGAHGVHR